MRPVTEQDLTAALARMNIPGYPLPIEPDPSTLPGMWPPRGWVAPSDLDDDAKPFLPSDDDEPWGL